jgi:hypothetical protein
MTAFIQTAHGTPTRAELLARAVALQPLLRAHALFAPAPGVSPPAGERRTDRRAAKAVWILELPGRSGTIHLMHHCRGFACSCRDLKTSGQCISHSLSNYRQIG